MFGVSKLNHCVHMALLFFFASILPKARRDNDIVKLKIPIRAEAAGIDCYECSSKNGSDPNCEDPFHPGHSGFSESCQVGKKNHIGKFPANFCVKITGQSTRSGENLMIRKCILENMDSQCGLFKFDNDELSGCILTCGDDGCNGAKSLHSATVFWAAVFTLICFLSGGRI